MKSLKVKLPPDLVPPKPSKYRNVPTIYGGVRYPSKAEADRAVYLDSLISGGTVRFWIGQPKFRLGCPENCYIADFLVIPISGFAWAEDVKGHRTAKFNRDVTLWRSYGPCELRIVTKGKVVDIIPGGKERK